VHGVHSLLLLLMISRFTVRVVVRIDVCPDHFKVRSPELFELMSDCKH